jgi:hypothetical protein
MGKRLTYEFVKESFEKEGYELLSREYINSRTKLKYKCPKGHEHSISWNNWQQGERCPYCNGSPPIDIDFVRSEFAKEGYELLSKDYKNNCTKLKYKCPKGHEYSITWHDWQSSRRCPYCYGSTKLTIEFVKKQFEKKNYKLLSTKYINAHTKLRYKCPKGHRHSIEWANWSQGQRCPYCVNLGKPTIEFIRSEFAKESYILLTKEYINAHQKLKYICSNGHKHSISWNNWKGGYRCPYCIIIVSKGEVEVRDFVKSLRIKVSSNNRSQIFNPETGNGLELDIFIPTLNKAIEYNGEYWHQDKTRDLFKQQLCKSKDIDLLTIWDKEWKTKRGICENRIKNFVFNSKRSI